jgi:glutamyl-tRNA synthetase
MTSSPPVVTRFAPSPTGFLHIGGARTALFNWLYARGHGGRFRLRIEDTDRARSTPEAVAAIVEGLTWLGLDWDDEIVSQATRVESHAAAALDLVASGGAYRDYLGAEETEAIKADLRGRGEAFRSPWRDRDPAEAPADAPYVVRFKGARDGETVVEDRVQGTVRFPNKDLDDLVLLRSDGTPTYNLAVVVDDHNMGVTHVVRGDDHLVNAGRQTQIYNALGWTPPVFAHVPLIHGPDGKKLSKRHGAEGVDAFRDLGCLPAGVRNYLLRLGWSHGDQEIFTDAEARAAFDLSGINKAPARLDLDKLAHVNAHHLRAMDSDGLLESLLEFLGRVRPDQFAIAKSRRMKLREAMGFLKDRAQTLADLAEHAQFLLCSRPIVIAPKARQMLNSDAAARLSRVAARLGALADWSLSAVKAALDAAAAEEGVGFGAIGGPMRAALTGGAPAPEIAVVLSLLGREETLERIRDAVGGAPVS